MPVRLYSGQERGAEGFHVGGEGLHLGLRGRVAEGAGEGGDGGGVLRGADRGAGHLPGGPSGPWGPCGPSLPCGPGGSSTPVAPRGMPKVKCTLEPSKLVLTVAESPGLSAFTPSTMALSDAKLERMDCQVRHPLTIRGVSRNWVQGIHRFFISAPALPTLRAMLFSKPMSTLAEIEAAVPRLTVSELAELEHFVRKAKREKAAVTGHSVLDIKPSNLGGMLRPLGTREEWYDEMLEGRV